jgi:hypothetical protein
MSVEPEDLRTAPGQVAGYHYNLGGNSIINVDDPTHPLDAVNLRTLNRALANAGLPTLEVESAE